MRYGNFFSIMGSVLVFFMILYFFLPLFLFFLTGFLIYAGVSSLFGKKVFSFHVMRSYKAREPFSQNKTNKPFHGEIIDTTLKKD